MTAVIDPRIVTPVSRLRDDLLSVAGGELVGVYVHGSAVLGDFIANSSDLDLLNVCRALRFATDGVLCSKSDGGRWALTNQIGTRLGQRCVDRPTAWFSRSHV